MKSQTALSLPVSFYLALVTPLIRKEELSILIKCVTWGLSNSIAKWKGYGYRGDTTLGMKLRSVYYVPDLSSSAVKDVICTLSWFSEQPSYL